MTSDHAPIESSERTPFLSDVATLQETRPEGRVYAERFEEFFTNLGAGATPCPACP